MLLKEVYSQQLREVSGVSFSYREVQIISLLINGYSTKKIAIFFGLSPRTIDNHLRNILGKIRVNSRQRVIEYIHNSKKEKVFHFLFKGMQLENLFFSILREIKINFCPPKPKNIFIENIEKVPPFVPEFIMKGFSFLDISFLVIQEGGYQTENGVLISLSANEFENGGKEITPLSDISIEISITDDKDLSKLELSINESISQINKLILYYDLFLQILGKVFKESPVKKELAKASERLWEKKEESFLGGYISKPSSEKLKFIKWMGGGFIVLLILAAYFLMPLSRNVQTPLEKDQIRSEIVLPSKQFLLDRRGLIQQIDNSFKSNENPIKVTLITGIAGAGKTTTARTYIYDRPERIVWEIDARSRESIMLSYERLADKLFTSAEERKFVNALSKRDTVEYKEKNLLPLIKKQLKKRSDEWLLFFDNVTSFSYIKNYIPNDYKIWGKGKILVATQNRNIENTQHVHEIVCIKELQNTELLKLFRIKVRNTPIEKKEKKDSKQLMNFLLKIPPYPLDVSIAAKYIMSTDISYSEYIDFLERADQTFQNMQQKILRETSDYKHTRAKIIKLTLDEVVNDKDFSKELLLFVAYCSGKDISRAILSKFRSSIVVNDFIYALKKFSLINMGEQYPQGKIFLHEAIQKEFLKYTYSFPDREEILKKVMKISYTESMAALKNEDFDLIGDLYLHLSSILKHLSGSTKYEVFLLKSCLGAMYYYLGETQKAKLLLDECIEYFSNITSAKEDLAWVYIFAGNIQRREGRYHQAISFYKKSIAIYKSLSKFGAPYAKASTYLGKLYEKVGRYGDAKNLLWDSYKIYKKLPSSLVQTGWVQSQLGKIYYQSKRYEKSILLFEESIKNYKKAKKNVGLSWVYGRIALSYLKLKDFKKAKFYILESKKICEDYFHENHLYLGKALSKEAIYYREIKEYKLSEEAFLKSLQILESNNYSGNLNMGSFYSEIGELYLQKGEIVKARYYFNKAIKIYGTYNPKKQEELTKLVNSISIFKV